MFFITSFLSGDSTETSLFLVFLAIIIFFLAVDLGFFNKKAHKITTRSALFQSIFWVCISAAFGGLIYYNFSHSPEGTHQHAVNATVEYFTSYLTEKALSVDNIFVILLILKYFRVKEEFFHKILFWGILGAVFFRAFFIFAGAYLVEQFHWILYLFGAFLVYSGTKIYFDKEEGKVDIEHNMVMRFCKKYLPIVADDASGKFLVIINGTLKFTPLFLVMVLIETTDILFAVDSIPAAFAITQDEFLIYTSNIFAVLGLRAMFFLLAGIIDRFYLLQKGLSIILVFIGGKMLMEYFGFQMSSVLSFIIIITTLFLSIILSVLLPEKVPEDDEIKF